MFSLSKFWKVQVPRKVLFFMWRFINMAITNTDNLRHHHLNIHIQCAFSDEIEETMTHIFKECHFARAIWLGISLGITFDQDPSKSIHQSMDITFL